MAGLWYALRSKPRKEDIVWRQVTQSGFETFYPRIRVNPVNPRSRKVQPYFPGYLFVLADLDQVGVSTFQWMPHTLGLVSFGGEPAYVPENLIIALRKRVEEIAAAGGELFDGLQPGDPVLRHSMRTDFHEAILATCIGQFSQHRIELKRIRCSMG